MQLRRTLIAGAAMALALLPCQAAQALQQTRVFVVFGNMGADDDRDNRTRRLLMQRLQRFAEDVKRAVPASQQHPVILFQVSRHPRLNAQAGAVVEGATEGLWTRDTVALMWGGYNLQGTAWVPDGNIFIGIDPIESSLRLRPSLFGSVQGTVSQSGGVLDAYEIIIGYALLRRIWRERRYELVAPIATVLKTRLRRAEGSGSYGSWEECMYQIERATLEISTGRRPSGNPPPRISQPAPVFCT